MDFVHGYCVVTLGYNGCMENLCMLFIEMKECSNVRHGYTGYGLFTVWSRLDKMATWEISVSCLKKRTEIQK